MPRLMLADEHWSKLRKILREVGVCDKPALRRMVEGMLYRLRTGCPWRDLPEYFGRWNSIYKKFNAWSASGKWRCVFRKLVIDPDLEWEFIDGSYVKAHQHSTGAVGEDSQAIGKSRAGNTSKIHLAVDSCGLPIEFLVTGGETHDSKAASELIAQLPAAEAVVADKANSVIGNADMDWALYRYRHLVKNAFASLKRFRALATRYDKLKINYESMVAMACGFLWLPM